MLPQRDRWSGYRCGSSTNFPIAPPIVVKDTPKPRRLGALKERALTSTRRSARPAERSRELWQRLKAVTSDEDAIEAIGDMRELLADEDLLVRPGGPL